MTKNKEVVKPVSKLAIKPAGKQVKDNFAVEKQTAQDLYFAGNLSQKEIAEILNVSETSIYEWKTAGKWDQFRGASASIMGELMENLYKKILELSKEPANNATDIAKIAASIEKLKPNKQTLTNYIQSFKDLGHWCLENDYLEEVKILTKVQKLFINEQLS